MRGAYGDAATSTIHERDVAAVAARALVNPAHAGHTYLLTGPQSLTQRDKVRLIGKAIGKKLSFEELPPEQLRQAMLAQGLPEDVPDRLLGSLADYAKQPGPSSDTVEQILGRPALTLPNGQPSTPSPSGTERKAIMTVSQQDLIDFTMMYATHDAHQCFACSSNPKRSSKPSASPTNGLKNL